MRVNEMKTLRFPYHEVINGPTPYLLTEVPNPQHSPVSPLVYVTGPKRSRAGQVTYTTWDAYFFSAEYFKFLNDSLWLIMPLNEILLSERYIFLMKN